jgi:DNA-binding GntR family transcriptional regulator
MMVQHDKIYETKQEWVYGALRNAICNCELEPGKRLLIDEIASEFKVSRIPVREALLQLQADGLVNIVPHAGAVVAPITFAAASDYFAVSRELQVLAVRAAAERITDEENKELHQFLDQMESAAKNKDYQLYTQLNLNFHAYIATISRMPLLPTFLEQFQQSWQRVVKYYHLSPMHEGRVEVTIQEHRELVDAICGGDADKAEAVSRRHNITGLEDHIHNMDLMKKGKK